MEGRLSGFEYRPYNASSVHPDADALRRLAILSRTANTILIDAAPHADAEHLHQQAIAALILGRVREALKLLDSAIILDSSNSALWNDLAATRYTAAKSFDDPYLLVEALAAAHRALAIYSDSAEANFNAGLILAALGLHDAARAHYVHSKMFDKGSRWESEDASRALRLSQPTLSDEWERERHQLEQSALAGEIGPVRQIVARFPQPARTWSEVFYLKEWAEAIAKHDFITANRRLTLVVSVSDALAELHGDTLLQKTVSAIRASNSSCTLRLAQAHRRYYEARVLYERRDVTKSLPMFVEVERELAACRSPMAAVAAYYTATALYDSGRTMEAEAKCRSLLATSHDTTATLKGLLLWTLANIQVRQGLLHDALSSQREALALFRYHREEVNSSAMERQAAGTLALLGRRTECWRLRIVNFNRISRLGDSRELQSALDTAARTEALDDQWDTATPFLALAADARLRQNPRVYASSLVWYALASQKLALPDSEGRLRRAIRAADALSDPTMRLRAKEDLTLVEAIGIRSHDPRRALVLLDRYIAGAGIYGNQLFLPEAYLQHALAARALGASSAAEANLHEALRLLADRRTRLVEQRITYFRTGETATRELIDLMVRRGAISEALSLLNDSRSTAIGFGAAPRQRPKVGLLIEYLSLADKLLIFTADRHAVRAIYVPVGETQLQESAQQFVRHVAEDVTSPSDSSLESWLVRPIAAAIAANQTIFIVPDRMVKPIPFGALHMPDGRYLVEHVEVVVIPARREPLRATRIGGRSVVAVGAPQLTGPLSDLPQIPNAAHEAAMVARGYPGATLLTGSTATAANVLANASHASILHFAVHAVVVTSEPSESYLALASSPRMPGTLSMERIARSALISSPIVVLAGCRTADSVDRVPKGFSLAEGFLAAGASAVVATLWDLPDDFTSEAFSLSFHEQIRRGQSPAAAVRATQLAMLHSSDLRLQRRSSWSIFQLYRAE